MTLEESLRREAAAHRANAARLEALADDIASAPDAWPGEYFSLAEVVASSTAERKGIDNTPDAAQLDALGAVVVHVADPLRRIVGALRCTSGLRVLDLNRAVGSKDTSQHVPGEALDLKRAGMTGYELADVLAAAGLPFDQLIAYHPSRGGHIHVSYRRDGANRGERRHAPEGGGYPLWTA